MKYTKQEDQLYSEYWETKDKIVYTLDYLINAKWDSNTLKFELENLMKQFYQISEAVDELENKK